MLDELGWQGVTMSMNPHGNRTPMKTSNKDFHTRRMVLPYDRAKKPEKKIQYG